MTAEILQKLIGVARSMHDQGLRIPAEIWSAIDTAVDRLIEELPGGREGLRA